MQVFVSELAFSSLDELKAMRKAAGWTQRELAERAGVHVQTVKYWEREQFTVGRMPNLFAAAFEAAEARNAAFFLSVQEGKTSDGAQCGARTRQDTRCRQKPAPGKCRCRFHGGRSTGPKTEEGRETIARAQRRRWVSWKIDRMIADRRASRAQQSPPMGS